MPRWLSVNASKAWGEKFFLLYSPLWMTFMGLVMALGVTKRVGEWGFLAIGLIVCLPLIAIPLLIRNEASISHRWYETYWFKANVYIGVFNFIVNYFGSAYFFDILGMVYHYPMIELNLQATLVGSSGQKVPLLMYLLTQAYFLTYHSTAVVVLRRIRTSALPVGKVLWPVIVVAVAYVWAWIETKSMANPYIETQFYYKNMERMLKYGSAFYALYFIPSFPIFYQIDEDNDDNWSLKHTVAAALCAGMIVLLLLDFAAKFFGPI